MSLRMKKRPAQRTMTTPLPSGEAPPPLPPMRLSRQLSILGGGSVPSSPQVKKACRLVVLGSTQTGKTCIVNRFLNGTYDDSYLPTIENFHRKLYKIHSEFYQLDILDTSGNDPFPAARRLSLLTGDMFLLVFSVDHPGSCDEMFQLRDQIMEIKDDSCGSSVGEKLYKKSFKSRATPIVVAANKLDLPKYKHVVNLDEVRMKLLNYNNCAFVECSAKDNLNVDDIFYKLFHLAKLPKQMSPSLHRHVCLEKSLDSAFVGDSGQSTTVPKKTSLVRLRSKNSEPTLVYNTDAKRPSLRTDLLSLKLKKQNQFTLTNPPATPNHIVTNGRKHSRCSVM